MSTLGIDLGTSAVKAMILEDDGTAAAQSSAPLTVARPRPGWSEQDPRDWWTATNEAVLQLPAAARAQVRAIGLAGQMHGAVLLDAAAEVIRPAILWNDSRAARACAELEARCPALPRITGNHAMPGFTAPKLLWVREQEPAHFAQIDRVLLPKDYLRLRLTGDYATDLSDAAGTLWVDVAARGWSDETLAACELERRQMPALFEGSAPTGTLRPTIAKRWGMTPVPVAAGAGDNAAGAIGCGLVHDGEGFVSLGTSGVLFLAGDHFAPNPARGVHAFCHALPGRWHQMAVTLSAASALDWALRLAGWQDIEAALTAAQKTLGYEAAPPVFLPYLTGERTPHNDPHACGVLYGLSPETGPAQLVQGVLEGVCFAFADGQQALAQAGGTIDALYAIGGGARSQWWLTLLATVLQQPLLLTSDGEHAVARGAARLAQLAAGAGSEQDICTRAPVTATIEPDPTLHGALANRLTVFRQLYPQLHSLWSPDDALQPH
ncbi:MAG: xylulokinase [Pseudomonadota bacterium]